MEFMKHIKESFAEQDGGGNAYKAFKERLKPATCAQGGDRRDASGEQEEASARRKRAIALLEQVLELFHPPAGWPRTGAEAVATRVAGGLEPWVAARSSI